MYRYIAIPDDALLGNRYLSYLKHPTSLECYNLKIPMARNTDTSRRRLHALTANINHSLVPCNLYSIRERGIRSSLGHT